MRAREEIPATSPDWRHGLSALPLAVLIGLAAAGTPGATAAETLRVHRPAPNAIVSGGGLVHVIVEVDAGVAAGALRARVKEQDLGPGTAKARRGGSTVVHWTARLAPGPNAIEVTLGDAGAPKARERRTVFYHEPVLTSEDPPRGFKPVAFHRASAEAPCTECHRLEPASGDASPSSPEQSTCHACHAALTKVKAVHGPAALWACTRCHDPASSPERYATPRPVMPLCFGCHQEQKDRFYGNPYQHGPTATGFCTICHNPHGTDNEFFVKKATWNLCTTCHSEKGSGRHVVSWGPSGQTHPTRQRPDPSRVGKELSCASCHNPHAAPGAKLWNFGAVRWMDLCKNCHTEIFGG